MVISLFIEEMLTGRFASLFFIARNIAKYCDTDAKVVLLQKIAKV